VFGRHGWEPTPPTSWPLFAPVGLRHLPAAAPSPRRGWGNPAAAPTATRDGQDPDCTSGPCHLWGTDCASARGRSSDRDPGTGKRPGRHILCGQPGAPGGPDQRLLVRGLCGRAQARGAIRKRSRKRQPAYASRQPSQRRRTSRPSYLDKSPIASNPSSAAAADCWPASACANDGGAGHSMQAGSGTGAVRRKNSWFAADLVAVLWCVCTALLLAHCSTRRPRAPSAPGRRLRKRMP
jgi:hypothetical protein